MLKRIGMLLNFVEISEEVGAFLLGVLKIGLITGFCRENLWPAGRVHDQ